MQHHNMQAAIAYLLNMSPSKGDDIHTVSHSTHDNSIQAHMVAMGLPEGIAASTIADLSLTHTFERYTVCHGDAEIGDVLAWVSDEGAGTFIYATSPFEPARSHVDTAVLHIEDEAANIRALPDYAYMSSNAAHAFALREWAGELFTMEGGDSPADQIAWVTQVIARLQSQGIDVTKD